MLNANTVGKARMNTLLNRLQELERAYPGAKGKKRRKIRDEIDLITAEIDRRKHAS